MAATGRHETGALLRAHLSAAAGFRHATGLCPVCRRLLRLALEHTPDGPATKIVSAGAPAAAARAGRSSAPGAASAARTRRVTASSCPPAARPAPRVVISAPSIFSEDESPLPR
ncbi:DUF6274 family protein [Streptomyces ochraceiscleroticus]|uniref:DUF6274 family protein n=1 Tax=Streptomyces ochraceiscleroticus TaxID=47761 RepID=A0ABW1MP51_9ACTN|nr:DUF6274 family protein [Streptomyces ochraceiscleroticus]